VVSKIATQNTDHRSAGLVPNIECTRTEPDGDVCRQPVAVNCSSESPAGDKLITLSDDSMVRLYCRDNTGSTSHCPLCLTFWPSP
jgi:hypothetical protein